MEEIEQSNFHKHRMILASQVTRFSCDYLAKECSTSGKLPKALPNLDDDMRKLSKVTLTSGLSRLLPPALGEAVNPID